MTDLLKLYNDRTAPRPTGGTPTLRRLRAAAYARFKERGWPAADWEDWRYVSLGPVLERAYADAPAELAAHGSAALERALGPLPVGHVRAVLVNGRYSARHSSAEFSCGAYLGPLTTAVEMEPRLAERFLGTEPERETNPFASLNLAEFTDGVFLSVPPDTALAERVELWLVTGPGGPHLSFPRILGILGAGASASVLVRHLRLGAEASLVDAACEWHLLDGARLTLAEAAGPGPAGSRIQTTDLYLDRNAHLDLTSLKTGPALVRSETRVRFKGEGAHADLRGLAVLAGTSESDERVLADHAVPGCVSRQYYKHVLADASRAEYNSLVDVHPGSTGSDSKQLCRNLLLSRQARAAARPQLLIRNDDVACSHGAATGQLDPNEIFYLRTRGLTDAAARTLLVRGFAEEILGLMPDAVWREVFELVLRERYCALAGEHGPA
ncbi:MAG: FeS cluster assembly protein SufD [Candidatus Omnitrophica bacterium]|nr:FeS cluster assembly protein SufD [Candidatus Omnitrophota bacterium]